VVRVASAGGERTGDRLLAAVTGLEGPALARALRPAVAANVLLADSDGYAFRHALIREAVHDELLPGERGQVHRRFAGAIAVVVGAGKHLFEDGNCPVPPSSSKGAATTTASSPTGTAGGAGGAAAARRVAHVLRADGTGTVTARVQPEAVHAADPLASIDGVTNAVVCRARPTGQVTIMGPGPGAGPQLVGKGVLSDVIAVARWQARNSRPRSQQTDGRQRSQAPGRHRTLLSAQPVSPLGKPARLPRRASR